jgi:uncharacterized protein
MLATLEQLLILQERDIRLHRAQKELGFIPIEEKQILSRLTQQSANFDALKKQAQHIESERKQLELQVGTKEEAIRKFQTHQAQTKKNDEYQNMGHEIERVRKEIDELEEQELVLMDQYDTAQKEVQAESVKVKEYERIATNHREELKKKHAILDQQVKELTAETSSLAAKIPPAELSSYRRILQSKGDIAIVSIVNGNICNGCHMKLTQQTIANAKAGTQILHCNDCGRILYWTLPQ